MIDYFLEAAYTKTASEQRDRALVDNMKKLPVEELKKLASGSVKLSYYGGGDGLEWLEKFKGTPLFEQAIAVEQQMLQNEIAEQQQRIEEDASRPARTEMWKARDALCLQKRMLELQLLQSSVAGEGAPAAPMPPPAAEAVPAEAPPAAPIGDANKVAAMKAVFKDTLKARMKKTAGVRTFLGNQAKRIAGGIEEVGKDIGHQVFSAPAKTVVEAPMKRTPTLVSGQGRGLMGMLRGEGVQEAEQAAAQHSGLLHAAKSMGGAAGGNITHPSDIAALEHATAQAAEARKMRRQTTGARLGAGALGVGALGAGALAAHHLGSTPPPEDPKLAFDVGAVGSTLKNIAGKVSNNKALLGAGIGAAAGAAGGAIAGGPDHRLSGALGGATLGAGAGFVGGNTAAAMGGSMKGQGLGAGLKRGLEMSGDQAKGFVSTARKEFGGVTPAVRTPNPAAAGPSMQRTLPGGMSGPPKTLAAAPLGVGPTGTLAG